MSKRTDNGTGTTDDSQREDNPAGESERSEREVELGAAGADDEDGEGDGDGEGERAADDTGDPQRAVLGLRKRVQKLTAQRNQSRAEVEELRSARAELQRYKEAERAARQEAEESQRRTPEGQEAEREAAAVRAAIDRTYGPGTSDRLARQQEVENQQRAAHGQKAVEYLTAELEAHDIEPTPEALLRWERGVVAELEADDEMGELYRHPATLKDAIEACVERVRDGLVNPTLKQRGADPLVRIERKREAVLGGGKNIGAAADAPEPKFDFTPPKDATPAQLEDFWRNAREQTWKNMPVGND